MEIDCKTDDDLLKYKGQTIGVVTEYCGYYGTTFGLLIGKLSDYDNYYRVRIGGNTTRLDGIKKAFTDPSEALAYYEYLSGE